MSRMLSAQHTAVCLREEELVEFCPFLGFAQVLPAAAFEVGGVDSLSHLLAGVFPHRNVKGSRQLRSETVLQGQCRHPPPPRQSRHRHAAALVPV